MKQAQRWHIVHDASSLKGQSVLMISGRGEFDIGGKTVVRDFPLKIAFPKDGKSATEAGECMRALKSDLGEKPEVPLATLQSSTSDNATTAAGCSECIAEEKEVRRMVPKTKEQAEAEAKMTQLQKATAARPVAERTCAGHTDNLAADAPHGKAEHAAVMECMALRAAACVLQRSVCKLICKRKQLRNAHCWRASSGRVLPIGNSLFRSCSLHALCDRRFQGSSLWQISEWSANFQFG